MSECWFIPDNVADQRAENRLTPNRPSDYETLADIGVFYKHFDPSDISDDVAGFIQPLLSQLGYHSHDVITIFKEAFGEEKFADMARQHFEEHLHEDDEVRLILEGSGYFDVRSAEDEWIRAHCKPGDCLVLPAGIYHRFTTDEGLYTKTVRLFKENPKWVAIAREGGTAEKTEARREYLRRLRAAPLTIAGPAGAGSDIFSLRYPNAFDRGMSRILHEFAKRVQEEGQRAKLPESQIGALLLFVTGAVSPDANGESWCPHCVTAKPHVLDGLKLLKEKYAHVGGDEAASGPVFFVEAPVQRAAYRGNPDYLYRTHEFLKIRGVPTVFVLTLKDGSHEAILEEEGKALKEGRWFDFVDVRARAERPTAQLLSSF